MRILIFGKEGKIDLVLFSQAIYWIYGIIIGHFNDFLKDSEVRIVDEDGTSRESGAMMVVNRVYCLNCA